MQMDAQALAGHVIDPAAAQLIRPAFGLAPASAAGPDGQAALWPAFIHRACPPAELAHRHDRARFAGMWERLLCVVREPAREHRVGHGRFVEVGGSIVIAIDPDGTLHPYVWRFGAHRKLSLKPMDEWAVVLPGLPGRDHWLRLLVRQATLEIANDGRPIADGHLAALEASSYTRWAFGCFMRQLRHHADLRQMRRRVAAALGVDAGVVRLAGRIPRTTLSARRVFVGAYNRVLRHRADFETLQREAPPLVPVFGALCEERGFPPAGEGEAAARLKRFLLEVVELSPRGWRVLTRIGARLFQPLTEFYRGDVAAAACSHLLLIDWLGWTAHTPPWLIRAAPACWGDAGNRWECYRMDFLPRLPLWEQAFRSVIGTDRPREQLEPEFERVQRWIASGDADLVMDKQQCAAGWPWLLGRARAWAERREHELCGQREWSTPVKEQVLGGWTLVPIRSPLQLWQEARSMHHCVDRFESACRRGETAIVSVRRDGRRVATAALEARDGRWFIGQVKAFANQEPPPRLTAALRRWVSEIDRAGPSPQARPAGCANDAEGVGPPRFSRKAG